MRVNDLRNSSQTPDLSGTLLDGRYLLRQAVGTGTSGTVYAADDTNLQRRVAVKVLHPSLSGDQEFVERFRSEARTVASLNHPHVLAIYDWGVDGSAYLVTEYLGGGSLRSMLSTGRTLSPAQALMLGLNACRALDHAHGQGLVHRDIKPANLLFNQDGRLCIGDFGLARALAEASHTEIFAEGMVGTVRYASPEQARGQMLDGRSDIYALALVLVEAVTGHVPFVADTLLGTLRARDGEAVPVPAALGPLGPIVQKAGAAEPVDRPSAAELGKMLLSAAPQMSRPEPLPLVGPGEVGAAPLPGEATMVAPRVSPPLATPRERPVRPVGPKRRWPAMLLAVLLLTGASVGGAWLWQGMQVDQSVVPSLAGRSIEEAHLRLMDLGWTVEERYERRDGTVEGQVLGTDPSAGAIFDVDQVVSVIVSLGPTRVEIPTGLAGVSLAEATRLLEEVGLVVGAVVETASEEVDFGLVAEVLFLADDLPRGGAVDLIVSTGPAPRVIPDGLVGGTADEAEQVLVSLGFVVERSEVFSESVGVGAVDSLSPAETMEVPFGSVVTLAISQGPMPRPVPGVIGFSLEAAEARLQAAGFRVIAVDGPLAGEVIGQNPMADEEAVPTDTIELITR